MRGGELLLLLGLAVSRLHATPLPTNNTHRNTKVLNFISLPDPQECLSDDNRRTGVCQNPYECRMMNGQAHGQCALGFGVCCVYAETCDGSLSTSVGYFTSPGYPGALTPISQDLIDECRIKIIKSAPEISQIRLDMVHFTLLHSMNRTKTNGVTTMKNKVNCGHAARLLQGQPNRKTGVCEQDMFTLRSSGNSNKLRMCGFNTGQHFYYDVDGEEEAAEIVIRLAKDHVSRFWEIKITQVEFKDRAPAGCLQYFKEEKGVIKTMNFADNGRHLADQDYNICIRQEEDMCSIVYEPCDQNSFKIGPSMPAFGTGGGGGGGAGGPGGTNPNTPNQLADSDPEAVEADDVGEEGSGFGGFNIFPLFGGSKRSSESRQMSYLRECDDRIVMPCDSEDLIPLTQQGPGVCDLLHCGNSFCLPEDGEVGGVGPAKCKIESSTLPFNIAVHFGPGLREENPEDNLGMCLRYTQQAC